MPSATPLRSTGVVDDAGLRVLSDPGLAYADGAEGRLAGIVADATDLASTSRELADAATDWATSYSLSPTRANLLRSVELRPDMRVLEIGCGCGPLTRYLGERVAAVDAVEPMPARARVARLRTRDLAGVEVCVGTLEDVPVEPVYDLVVVVGVLEYVGQGAASRVPYLEFLARCRDLLVDGGTLLVAIENALGVKYLAGAGEDHTNRPFDSLEGYLLQSPARTFSREVLTGLVREAGLTPATVLGAFPDYKMPRAVLADRLFDDAPDLAVRLPRFPSPDWVVPRLQLADEARLWRTLVEAGVAREFVNSFVVLATKGGGPSLWPADRLAVMFTTERQPWYAVRSEVVAQAGGLVMRRAPMGAELRPADAELPDLRHTPPAQEEVRLGAELVDLLASQPERREELLRAWADLVPGDEWAPVDLVPHNLLVASDGSLVVVDQEWRFRGYDRDCLLVRGLVWTAVRLAAATRPEAHDAPRTVRDVVAELAAHLDLELTDDLLDRFVAAESRFQAAVNTAAALEQDRRRRSAEDLRAILGQDVLELRGGERFDLQWARAVEELRITGEKVGALHERIHVLEHPDPVPTRQLARQLGGRALRRLGLRR